MDSVEILQPLTTKPLFEPSYLNIEYVFGHIYSAIEPTIGFIFSSNTWSTIGVISSILSLICIAVIVFSIVRMREIQLHEKEEIDHEIAHALSRKKESDRNTNPRWHYIQTLIESPNESDWRVAIIEADSLLEDTLKERGLSGTTVSELLEDAKSNGYRSIQDAWDGHTVRNKIAHEGSTYPISQIEGRRVIKLFQNFFEEIRVI